MRVTHRCGHPFLMGGCGHLLREWHGRVRLYQLAHLCQLSLGRWIFRGVMLNRTAWVRSHESHESRFKFHDPRNSSSSNSRDPERIRERLYPLHIVSFTQKVNGATDDLGPTPVRRNRMDRISRIKDKKQFLIFAPGALFSCPSCSCLSFSLGLLSVLIRPDRWADLFLTVAFS